MKRLITIICTCVIVLTFIGCQEIETETQSIYYTLGDEINFVDNYTLIISEIHYYSPKDVSFFLDEGYEIIELKITLTNISTVETKVYNCENCKLAIDGKILNDVCQPPNNHKLFSATLAPGNSATGYLAYKAPIGWSTLSFVPEFSNTSVLENNFILELHDN